MTKTTRLSFQVLWMLLLGYGAALGPMAIAQEPIILQNRTSDEPVPNDAEQSRVVVIRIAGKLLEEAVNREIDEDYDISTCILDTWCEGSGNAKGTSSMDFAGSELEQALPVHVVGTMFSRSTAYSGPVVTTSRADSTFSAVFSVDFDGQKFYHKSSSVSVSTHSTIESICATSRIGRRLVQRLAWRVAPGQVPRYVAAGERLTEQQIDQAASEVIRSQLQEVNEAVQFEATLHKLAASEGYQRLVTKTDTYIQVRVAPQGKDQIVPPKQGLLSDSPIEIWIHPRLNQQVLAMLAGEWRGTQGELADFLPKLPLPSIVDDVSIIGVDQWDVIKVGRVPELLRRIGADAN